MPSLLREYYYIACQAYIESATALSDIAYYTSQRNMASYFMSKPHKPREITRHTREITRHTPGQV